MVQTFHQTCDIQRVRAVLPCEDGMQVVFPTGLSVCLRKGHPEYDRFLNHARNSLQHGGPVGFLVSETGELIDLNYVHQAAVRQVRPDEDDPSRLMVAFWEYSPICYLTKDHPEFERVKHTLERAAATNEQVVVANHGHVVEGETETWLKILDVRPA